MNTHIWYKCDLPVSHISHLKGIKIIRLYKDRLIITSFYPIVILYATTLEGVYNIQNQYFMERIRNIENMIKVNNFIAYSYANKDYTSNIEKCKDIYGDVKKKDN